MHVHVDCVMLGNRCVSRAARVLQHVSVRSDSRWWWEENLCFLKYSECLINFCLLICSLSVLQPCTINYIFITWYGVWKAVCATELKKKKVWRGFFFTHNSDFFIAILTFFSDLWYITSQLSNFKVQKNTDMQHWHSFFTMKVAIIQLIQERSLKWCTDAILLRLIERLSKAIY